MENLQWLLENGGPSIKLNMMNEGLIDKNAYDAEKLVDELLQIEKVKTALTYFDKFKNHRSISYRELSGFIHNAYEDCYEMFMRFFINLGFRAGISLFDEKVEYMRETYKYMMTLYDGYWPTIIMKMLEAGYYYDDMLNWLTTGHFEKMCNTARQQYFDIYETDPTKIRWSKLPKIWKDGPICKDIHVASKDSELPVPTAYDLNYMASIYAYVEDKTIKEKIETIVKYIMHPGYQKLRGFLGVSWYYDKAYYAPSPGVVLPLYEDNKFEGYGHKENLDMMSRFPFVTSSDWFKNCINFLGNFKTERGTYMLPESCFYTIFLRPADTATVYNAYISKDAKIKRKEKRSFAIELLSTYFVLLMQKRMDN